MVPPRRVVWSAHARHDLREIVAYIAARDPRAATRVADRIDRAARDLAVLPTGRRGRVAGTCERALPPLPYILAYSIERDTGGGETIAVLRVIHGARDWPAGQWPG